MPQASIDQFAVAHGLEKAGFDARQAEAMVRAMNVISGSSEQIADDLTQLLTREEFERHLRGFYVRLYVTVGAATAFSAGLNFAILQFMLS